MTILSEPISLATHERLLAFEFTFLVDSLVLVLRRVAGGRRVLAGLLGRGADGIGSWRFATPIVTRAEVRLGESLIAQLPLPPLLKVMCTIGVDRLLREVVGAGAGCKLLATSMEEITGGSKFEVRQHTNAEGAPSKPVVKLAMWSIGDT